MKTLKSITVVLIAVFLFQGCYVAKKRQNISRKAIVVNTDGTKSRPYYRVHFNEDSTMYGIRYKGSTHHLKLSNVKEVKYLHPVSTVIIVIAAWGAISFLLYLPMVN